MFIWRELGGTGTGCLFQFTYCEYVFYHRDVCIQHIIDSMCL